jgi:hypothetical protein
MAIDTPQLALSGSEYDGAVEERMSQRLVSFKQSGQTLFRLKVFCGPSDKTCKSEAVMATALLRLGDSEAIMAFI